MADLEATAGQQVTLTAAHAGIATDVEWAWSKPAGSTAPASAASTLQWVIAETDFGDYSATATSATAVDTPQQGTIRIVEAAPAGELWTPADLPGVFSWIDFSDEGTLTVTDGKIVQANNKIAGGPTLAQPDAGSRMSLASDMFNGVHRTYGSIPVGLKIVLRFDAVPSNIMCYFGAGSMLEEAWVPFADGPLYHFNGGAYGSDKLIHHEWALASNTKDRGGPIELRGAKRWNGQRTFFLILPPSPASSTGFEGSADARIAAGDRFEWILGSQPIGPEDQARGEGYLAHKWGMQELLPADHPYKATPPLKPVP